MKAIAKSLVYGIWPNLENKRFLEQYSQAEPEIMLLAVLVPSGSLALDIGANRGLYIHHLMKRTDRIVAFEPLEPMQQWLRRFYRNLDLRTVALSDGEGTAVIRYPRGNFSWATLAQSNDLKLADAEIVETEVPLRTLDSFNFKDVGFIKIDVEGYEEAVLHGAGRTLGDFPSLLIEIEDRHNPGSPQRIRALLAERGYAGFFISDGALVSMDQFDPTVDAPLANVGVGGKRGRYINNFIFVPKTRAGSFSAEASRLLAP